MADIPIYIVARTPVARSGLRAMLDAEIVVGEGSVLPDYEGIRGAEVVLVAGDEVLGDSPVGGYPDLAFVILTDDGEKTLSWIRNAAPFGWAILAPDAEPEEITASISAVANGLAVLPRHVAEEIVAEARFTEDEPPPETLTARELEVLALLAEGLSNKNIARKLFISEHTVKFHLSQIFAKLDVSSRAGAVSRGARFGLISL